MARTALFSRKTPGGVFNIEDQSLSTGQRFFVHSGTGSAGTGYGYSPDSPLSTIAGALTLATANAGDIIYCLPGHAESSGAADGINFNKAGVSVIGLGNGSNRPTLTLDTATTATLRVSAANVTLRNLIVKCDEDEVVTGLHVTAANCTIDGVDFHETSAKQLRQFLLTTAAANDLTVKNCRHYQATAAAAAQVWLGLVGTDRAVIVDNIFHVTAANNANSHMIQVVTTAAKDLTIARNTIVLLGGTTIAAAIKILNGSSGQVHDNRVALTTTTLAASIDLGDGVYGNENYTVKAVNKSGIIDPVVE